MEKNTCEIFAQQNADSRSSETRSLGRRHDFRWEGRIAYECSPRLRVCTEQRVHLATIADIIVCVHDENTARSMMPYWCVWIIDRVQYRLRRSTSFDRVCSSYLLRIGQCWILQRVLATWDPVFHFISVDFFTLKSSRNPTISSHYVFSRPYTTSEHATDLNSEHF